MNTTIVTVNGNTKLVFTSPNLPTATTVRWSTLAAKRLWDRGLGPHGTEEAPILFTSLSNQQIATMLGDYWQRVIIGLANEQDKLESDAAAEAARVPITLS